MTKLFLTDLDGTLLKDDHATFSSRCAQALLKLQQNGIKLCVCTGRSICTLPRQILKLNFDYAITSNGGSCTDLHTGEILFHNYMSAEKARFLWEESRSYHPYALWYVQNRMVLDQNCYDLWPEKVKGSWIREYLNLGTCKVYPTIECFFEEGAPCLEKTNLTYLPAEITPSFVEKLKSTGWFDVTSSLGTSLEITDCAAKKGLALKQLCDFLGFSPLDSIAFGDGNNDTGMLLTAGIGVAMGNACSEVLEAADAVTLSNEEDGIADFLEKQFSL